MLTILGILAVTAAAGGYMMYKGAGAKVLETISDIGIAIMSSLTWFFMDLAINLMKGATYLLNMLPDFFNPTGTSSQLIKELPYVLDLAGKMNKVFPIVEIVMMFVAGVIFLAAFIAYKQILKWIPTIG